MSTIFNQHYFRVIVLGVQYIMYYSSQYWLPYFMLLCCAIYLNCCNRHNPVKLHCSEAHFRSVDGIVFLRQKRNAYANMSIAEEWLSYWGKPRKLHSNDTKIPHIDPYPTDYLVNGDISVCSNETFLLMVYPIRFSDREMRDIIRSVIPQGIVINGKTINRVFVIAVDDSNRMGLRQAREEKKQFHDILISRHNDSYYSVPLSVWDGLIWARDHCHHATYIGKFDPDAIVMLGNLIRFLLKASIQRLYGGKRTYNYLRSRTGENVLWTVPFDYPEKRRVDFISGPAVMMTQDVVDYLVTGAEYEPFFAVAADDLMAGAILSRVGINPTELAQRGCPFMIWRNHRTEDYTVLPNCFAVYHDVKNTNTYREIVAFLGKRLYA